MTPGIQEGPSGPATPATPTPATPRMPATPGTPPATPAPPGGRDRDQAGRPRNARPRDAAGRPLRRGTTGEPRVPDDLALRPPEALELAQRLLDTGRPFQAHEVLEASWKAAPAAERDLWQGLAQIAVGLTHAQRGNARGAVALLRRGAGRIGGYLRADAAGRAGPHDIDVRAVIRAADELAGRIERDGLDAMAPGDLRLRLRLRHAAGLVTPEQPGRPAAES